jgi:hypothetical protein
MLLSQVFWGDSTLLELLGSEDDGTILRNTSTIYQSIRHNAQEDFNLQIREGLKIGTKKNIWSQ